MFFLSKVIKGFPYTEKKTLQDCKTSAIFAVSLEVCGLRPGTATQENPPFKGLLLAAAFWTTALGAAKGDPLPYTEHTPSCSQVESGT